MGDAMAQQGNSDHEVDRGGHPFALFAAFLAVAAVAQPWEAEPPFWATGLVLIAASETTKHFGKRRA